MEDRGIRAEAQRQYAYFLSGFQVRRMAVAAALPLRVLQRFSVLGFAPPSAAAFRFGRCVGRALRSKRSPL